MDFSLIRIVFLTTVVAYIGKKLYGFLRIVYHLSKIPHREGNFLFANIPRIRRMQQELGDAPVTRLYYKYMREEGAHFQRKKHGCHFAGIINPMVTVVSWKTGKDIMLSSEELDKPFQYTHLANWLGWSLLTSSGEVWKGKRRLMSKGFHTKNLKSFIPIMNQHANSLCESIYEKQDKSNGLLNGKIAIKSFHFSILHSTLSIILDCMMGVKADEDKSVYSHSLDGYAEVFTKRLVSPWMWFESTFNLTPDGKKNRQYVKNMWSFTEKAIQRRLSEKEQEQKLGLQSAKRNIILDMILNSFPRSEARNEIDTLVFAGHDTTAMGVFYTLFLLAHHPDIQERLYRELIENQKSLSDCDDDNEDFAEDYDTIKNNFPYLDAVVKESMRVLPPVFFVARRLTKDVTVPAPDGCPDRKEYFLPEGSIAQYDIGSIQADPDFYPEPEKFKPERFLGQTQEAYIPFALGPRNCIGNKFALLEMKILLTKMVKRFQISSPTPPDQLELRFEMIIKPGNPNIIMEFTPRTSI